MKNDVATVTKLISDFNSFVENRSPNFLVNFDEVFPKILEWNFIAWQQYWLKHENEKDEWLSWFQLHQTFRNLINRIGEKSYEDHQFLFSVAFLKKFHTHFNIRKEEYAIVEGNKRFYVSYIFAIFFQVLLKFVETADLAEKNYFWEQFPKEWKIRKETYRNFGQLSYNEFMNWAQWRIRERRESDLLLQEITENLFPTVDVKIWSRLLFFAFSAYQEGKKVKSVIERPWSFGFRRQSFAVYQVNTLEDIPKPVTPDETEQIRTFELALFLPHFSSLFTEENLRKYKTEAEKLDYPEDSYGDRRKKELLEIFDGLLDCLKKRNEEKPK